MISAGINEQQRQAYLQAMGVQPWFSRYVLPNAKISEQCEWVWPQVDDSNTVVALPAAPAQQYATPSPRPKSSRPPLAELRQQTELPEKVAEASEPPISKPLTVAAPELQRAPTFRLFMIPVGDEGLVIGDLPYSGHVFSRYHMSFIGDMLRALQHLPEQPLQHRDFSWPVCEPLVRAYGEQGGVDGVRGFLDNQLGLQGRRWILVLGRQALRYGADLEGDFDSLRGRRQHADKLLLVTYSVTEMMRVPQLKAQAWQDLKSN